jgi:hypothetical protein
MTITFAVSSVQHNKQKLPTIRPAEALLTRQLPLPHALSTSEPLVQCEAHNGLLMALHLAYQHHYPLILSPDDIWLCIAQGFAEHINRNAEKFRARFVSHQGQEALSIKRDEFQRDPAKNDWAEVIGELSSLLRQYIGRKADLFEANFSTTGTAERIASQLVMMGAFEKYFSYEVHSKCGIPEITLLGTPEDWANIRQRAEVFSEFDLDWWLEHLRPFLANVEATSREQIDQKFWGNLYKWNHASGGDKVTGWVNALFPYIDEYKNSFELPPDDPKLRRWFSGTNFDRFPPGLTKVPFVWKYDEEKIPLELVGGFLGARQDPTSKAIRPVIGWALIDAGQKPTFFVDHGMADWNGPILTPIEDSITSLEAVSKEAAQFKDFTLHLHGCEQLSSLQGLEGLSNLKELSVDECEAIQDLTPLEDLSLRELSLRGCTGVQRIDTLASLHSLESLDLSGCASVTDLSPLANLPNLERLVLEGCGALFKKQEYETRAEVKAFQTKLKKNR